MSTHSAAEVAVGRTVTVPLPPAQAFELFTARMTDYWPAEHSSSESPFAEVVVEPWAGGRWFERAADGSECDWGRTAYWDPPHRVVLLWQITADWCFDADFETEVEVPSPRRLPATPGSICGIDICSATAIAPSRCARCSTRRTGGPIPSTGSFGS
jgi:hypothetical protein